MIYKYLITLRNPHFRSWVFFLCIQVFKMQL